MAQRGFKSQRSREPLLPLGSAKWLLSVDTGAEGGEFVINERLIHPRRPIFWQWNRRRIGKVGPVQTRPGPLAGVCRQPGTDRIAEHIAQDCEEMAVLLNGEAFETPLPHMPMTAVVPMIAADMTGHPPLHEGAERGFRQRLHDEMKMIRHQTEAQECDGILGFRRGEQVEEGGVVALLVEDRSATVPAIQDMVGVPDHLTTRNPRHGVNRVGEIGGSGNRKVGLRGSQWVRFCTPS